MPWTGKGVVLCHQVWLWLAMTSRLKTGCCLCLSDISDGFHDYFPWFSSRRSVCQEESFRIVCLLVQSRFRKQSTMECTVLSWFRLSSSPSFSNNCANGPQSTHNVTIKFPSAEERIMFRIGMLLPRPVPLHHSANLTQWTVSQRVGVESGRTNDRDWLIRSQTTPH